MLWEPMPELTVLYMRERKAAEWAARHERGEVPGLWPYGLNELDQWHTPTRLGELEPPNFATRVRGRLVPARLRTRRSSRPGDIAITWDENAAHRMVTTAPRDEMYSGIIWLNDRLASRPPSEFRSMRRSLSSLAGVWVNSSAQVETLQRFVGSGTRVGFFRFGVDSTFFPAQPPSERPMVLSIGGDRDRDPATLFGALERVHARMPEVELVVQTSSTATPPPGVTTLPHVSHVELRALYARASVVAIATRQNLHVSGTTVSLEAMSSARPVVITRTPGTEDYTADGVTGLLSQTGDPVLLADRILELLAEPEAAANMGRAGRQAVENGLTTSHMTANLASFMNLPQPA
jgi:glycosyltransferase involved in cell wall biosynthesis